MVNDVYLHEAQTPGRNRGRGRFVSGSAGVGLQGRASLHGAGASIPQRNLFPPRSVHAPAPRLFEKR